MMEYDLPTLHSKKRSEVPCLGRVRLGRCNYLEQYILLLQLPSMKGTPLLQES